MSETEKVSGKTMNAAAWVLFGVVATRLANLMMTIVLARILVPADFGLVAIATTVLLMLSGITELSLANALIHKKDITKSDYDTAFTLGLLRGILLSAIMVVSGYLLASTYNDDRLILIMQVLSVRTLIMGLTSPTYVKFAKDLKFGAVVLPEATAAFLQLLSAVAVAFFTRSYWGIVVGVLASGVVPVVASYLLAPYKPSLSLASWRTIMSFSVWVTLTQFINVVGSRFDGLLAAGLLGTAVFGAYNVGNNVAVMLTQSAIQPLERVFFPSFSKIVYDRERIKQAFQRSQASLLAIGLPLGFGCALVAGPLVYLALGPQWSVAATVIQWVAPVLGLQVIFGSTNALAYALGETKFLFTRSVVQMFVRVPLVVAGLYFYGLLGILVARVASGGITLLFLNFILVRKLIGISIVDQVAVNWRSILSTMVMSLLLLWLDLTLPDFHTSSAAAKQLALLIAAGGLAYFITHYLAWVFSGRSHIGIESELARIVNKKKFFKVDQA